MNSVIDEINSKLRPAIKQRIGTQVNVEGAKAIMQSQTKSTSFSGGQLAYGLVLEAVQWASTNVYGNFNNMPELDNTIITGMQNICAKANNTHANGTKAAAGAAIGLNFGWLGAALGAVAGWALGQNASNSDLNAIIMYANQSVDYMCDSLCQKVHLIEGKSAINNNQQPKNDASPNKEPTSGKDVKKNKEGYPKFSDVIGLEEAKQAIQERVIDPAKHPDVYKKYGYKAGGGILLYGLPGTGKTMFAQAVANELDGKFFSIKASDIKSKWYGQTEEKIKSLFAEARKEKVSIIFIDEFEAIGIDRNKAGSDDPTASSVVPELLAQMQGFEKDEDNILLVICATNRPWDIDSALTRPGRLDYKVYVELPNKECRLAMFKNYLKKVQIFDSALNSLVEKTEGYNGADIKNVCDSLVKIVINKEIAGTSNYHLDLTDVSNVLNKIKSSVSKNDIYLMDLFRSQK